MNAARIKPCRQYKTGKKMPVVSFENGKVRSREGAVPVMKGKLDWIFLNKSKKGWKSIPDQSPPVEQFVGFGTPLTNEQFELLAAEVSE